jgi:hypothetical protein
MYEAAPVADEGGPVTGEPLHRIELDLPVLEQLTATDQTVERQALRAYGHQA